ncbi:hypothetical protein E2C01_007563 [Portunus trituberculatus]|uniref:Uncharacterized protein n=1 Tax=Portunus trituberculatus TaxID=210409 RepID=A0A5B7CZS1_PORTR|nr:hypothetical protein [Portunus trituberculatus]
MPPPRWSCGADPITLFMGFIGALSGDGEGDGGGDELVVVVVSVLVRDTSIHQGTVPPPPPPPPPPPRAAPSSKPYSNPRHPQASSTQMNPVIILSSTNEVRWGIRTGHLFYFAAARLDFSVFSEGEVAVVVVVVMVVVEKEEMSLGERDTRVGRYTKSY